MAYLSNALRRYLTNSPKSLIAQYSSAANTGPIRTTPGKELRTMFSAQRVRKNWELSPLFIIIGGAVVGLCGFIMYASQTRDDVRYFSKANFEKTDLLNPKKRKLVVFDQEYRPMNEVFEAYKAIEEDEQKAAK